MACLSGPRKAEGSAVRPHPLAPGEEGCGSCPEGYQARAQRTRRPLHLTTARLCGVRWTPDGRMRTRALAGGGFGHPPTRVEGLARGRVSAVRWAHVCGHRRVRPRACVSFC